MNSVVRIESLNRENYDTWKLQMQALLIKNDAWGYINGDLPMPTVTEDNKNEIATWKKNDSKAMSDIILSIHPSELKQIKGCEKSRDAWLKLENIYQSKGPARKATLLKDLTLRRMEENGDLRDHLNKFFDAVDKLEDMEVSINKDLLSIMLLYSLPTSFENFRCAIESRDELPSPEILRIKITEEYEARKSDLRTSAENAMYAKKFQKWRTSKYEKGNNRKSSEIDNKNEFKFRCHKCREIGHKATDCDKKKITAKKADNVSVFADVAYHARQIEAHGKQWCLDSGATSHLSNDIGAFVDIKEISDGKLNLANNTSTTIHAKGTAKIVANVSGETRNITLGNTYHIPDLRSGLVSVSKITDNGFKVVFLKNRAEMIDPEGQIKMIADRIGDLYYVREEPESARNVIPKTSKIKNTNEKAQNCSTSMWHYRLGHLNYKDLLNAWRSNSLRGMNLTNVKEDLNCSVCIKGKMTRLPFPKCSERVSNPLEIIHSDVCGPMRCKSLGKSTYFATFIDDASRWCEVRFLRTKDEVFDAFKEVKALMENKKGKKIRFLQTDNGTEYVNEKFDKFLKESGISRRLSVPYHPEQNGISERKNRTLLDTSRCLLIQSGLSDKFWAEAVNTANYIRNRCPTTTLKGKSPYELWNEEKPEVSHLKIFGCKVFCLDTKPGKGKFQPRSKEGRFVGYSDICKGYRVWFPTENTVQMVRDVKFQEEIETSKTENEKFKTTAPSVEIPISENESDRRFVEFYEPFPSNLPDEIENPEDNPIINCDNDDEQNPDTTATLKRKPGAPRVIRTRKRGRPKKKYNLVPVEKLNQVEMELTQLAEIPFIQAVNGPHSEEWYDAIADEVSAIIKNNTWEIVDQTESMEVIGSRLVLRNKCKPDGTPQRRKARLVAQGFSQRPGIHYFQTFAPVARLSTVRLLTSLAASSHCPIHQLDVTTAYLNGELEEVIYMKPPKGLEEGLKIIISENRFVEHIKTKARSMLHQLKSGGKVCHLKKALYGLRQAGRAWYSKLDCTLTEIGAVASKCDPCLYYIKKGKSLTLILIYVDDILISSPDKQLLNEIIRKLSDKFEVKNMGAVDYCLGIQFCKNSDGISLNQKSYVRELLERFGMSDAKPVTAPMSLGEKLSKPKEEPTEEEKKLPFRELVGALNYLAMGTRPDISHAVSCLGQYNNCFDRSHWTAAKRVLRYLKGTSDVGIRFLHTDEKLKGYVDADWGNNVDDRRSYSGYVFVLNGGPISWESRKQRTVALSSTEAEYMAMAEAAKESLFLRRILEELGHSELTDITVYSDNMGAKKLAENPVFHNRSKHIDLRHHFIRDIVGEGTIKIEYLATEDMPADILTKGLGGPRHRILMDKLGLQVLSTS